MNSESITISARSEEPHPASPAKDDSSRCRFRYSNGERCRIPSQLSQSGLCSRHSRRNRAVTLSQLSIPSDCEDLSAELLSESPGFDSGVPINQFLTRLLTLAIKGRVTPRRASVLAYITNQLLHSLPAVEHELAPDSGGPDIIIDMPGPNRD
jgi:hypothetical protein